VVLTMQSLWNDEVASFDGDHVHLSPSWAWPKPVHGHLPVLLGGAPGPTLFAHIAEYGDGWMPVGGAGLSDAIPELRRVVSEAGRDPDQLEIVPFGSLPDPGKLEHFAEIGVTETIFRVPSAGADEVLPILDRWAKLIA